MTEAPCPTIMLRHAPRPGWVGAVVLAALLNLQGCAELPTQEGRSRSVAPEQTDDTHLGRAVVALTAMHPGQSGVIALPRGVDAFAARARLADVAERSLDVQYYIWRNDLSGKLLFDALRRAAARGVRVRLLLDDGGTVGIDETLAELASHPNIEVRLFNPSLTRGWRALGYLTDFSRLNRRMHNKSFTADNQVSIVGGRNVGDEYFSASASLQFVDLDVMAIGGVVHRVSEDFDRYWASDSAYPAERLLGPPRLSAVAVAEPVRTVEAADAAAYIEALAQQPFVRAMLEQALAFEWAEVQLVSDDPAKGEGRATIDQLLWTRLKRVMPPPQSELVLVSPYFVPGDGGVDDLIDLRRRGVKVTVFTNSLEATDVAAVHAGYAKRRNPLLDAGVELYELKLTEPATASPGGGGLGSSSASLHAKTFMVDRSALFVGSFNFDPRSARLNTEMGLVIESPTLAAAASDAVMSLLRDRAYRVSLAPGGGLVWTEQVNGKSVLHDKEPSAGFWKQLGVSVLSLLPIEWLL